MSEKKNSLIKDILAKRELSNLQPDIVLEKLEPFLKNNKKVRIKFEESDYEKFRRSKEFDEIIKNVRAQLRTVYGVFILEDYKKRHELLKNLDDDLTLQNHKKILELHQSSKERLDIYDLVYKKIFEITGLPKSILDLACGLNPVSYPLLGCKPKYTACDLSETDLEFIDDYFKMLKISGSTKKIDLLKDFASVSELSKMADVTFLFKALDSLEAVRWNASKQLIDSIRSNWLVVSFATKSIGGRKEIKKEKRNWFEKLLKRKGLEHSEFELPGEYFYVIRMN